MKVKVNPEGIEKQLDAICKAIEKTIERYSEFYAEYGWDNFTETLSNSAAQIYMMKTMIHNAEVMERGRQ